MNQDLAISRDRVRDAAETNHRIANNLALLTSLVRLDGLSVLDPQARTILETTRRRIHAIASLHRRLYRAGGRDSVDLGAFLTELGDDLRAICEDAGRRRRLTFEAAHIFVTEQDAAAIGILVAELVSNACKHAYAEHEQGAIRVMLAASRSGAWTLTVEDDGRGLHGTRPDETRPGLGSFLVSTTAKRLEAGYLWENAQPGTRFVMWSNRAALSHG